MRNHLVYRFILVNTGFVALAGALAVEGHLLGVFERDLSNISYGIAALFVIAWLWTFKEIIVASCDLNWSSDNGPRPAAIADADKDLGKVAWLNDITEYLVQLGLLGTVIGFVIALSGVNTDTIASATGAQTAVAMLMEGMGTALGTTILGASLSLWHGVNMRMLSTALSTYWNDRILAPEYHRRD